MNQKREREDGDGVEKSQQNGCCVVERRAEIQRHLRDRGDRFRGDRGEIYVLRIEKIETGKAVGHLRRREEFNESEKNERG